jgi:hypothetical protein
MKVRLGDGDIRLRLNEFEVATVLEGRPIVTTMAEGFAVHLVPGGHDVSSVENVESGHIVNVPTSGVRSPSLVSPAMYESPSAQSPHILVEMDRQT